MHIVSDRQRSVNNNFDLAKLPQPPSCGLYYTYRLCTGLLLRSEHFAMTKDRKACNMSKLSEFCLELNA